MTTESQLSTMEKRVIGRAGFLIMWSLPEVLIGHGELEELADRVGFPSDLLPKQPRSKSIWEAATNIPSTHVDLRPDFVSEVKEEFGVKPKGKIFTRIIKGTYPIMVRHLVREVIIPDSMGVETDSASVYRASREQRKNATVANMYFIAGEENERDRLMWEVMPHDDYVSKAEIDAVVDAIREKISIAMGNYNSQKIRQTVRKWLDLRHATLLSQAGGVYFVPNTGDHVRPAVEKFKAFMDGLKPFADNKEKIPTCMIFEVTPEGDSFFCTEDIADGAARMIRDRIKALKDMNAEVGKKRGKYRDKLVAHIREEWGNIHQTIKAYQRVFESEFSELSSEIESGRQVLGSLAHVVVGDQAFSGLDQLARMVKATQSEELKARESTVAKIGGIELKF